MPWNASVLSNSPWNSNCPRNAAPSDDEEELSELELLGELGELVVDGEDVLLEVEANAVDDDVLCASVDCDELEVEANAVLLDVELLLADDGEDEDELSTTAPLDVLLLLALLGELDVD